MSSPPRRATYVRHDAYTGRPQPGAAKAALASGSREHYFHFLIGYLLPLVHAQRTRPLRDYAVLDCGPLMTPLLEATLVRLREPFAAVVAPAAVTHPVPVEAWDEHWDDTAAVREAAAAVMDAWQDAGPCCPQPDCPDPAAEALLIERSPPPDYYLDGGGAERPGYGLSRRGIVNWPEVHEHLTRQGIAHARYEPGRHSLACQIARFRGARRIVGIRGAEWANVVWSRPGLRVRVLDPEPPARLIGGLFTRLGVDSQMVRVRGTAVREDPAAVARFLLSTTA